MQNITKSNSMKQPFLIWMITLLILPFSAIAQQITISGYVTEKKSGERLIGATVFVPEKSVGTATNAFGFYSITLPADTLKLRASFIGYQPFEKTIYPNGNLSLNIELEMPESKNLQEVVVKAEKEVLQNRTQMSSIDLPIQTIKSLPAFLGEVDIMKAIQLLPGVQAGSEGSSGLYVRGGGPDQNLILLDGVPVYNASHLFGFFSVFNADAIRNVDVVKGGFPARYGGRLSSVIDINMKEGDKNEIHGEGGIGIVASRLTLEGPIQKGKSSFMFSGRRTYIDYLAKPIIKQNGGDAGYYFYDLNGKVNFYLGKRDHLYLSGYFGNDKFYAKDENDNSYYKSGIQWGNITGVARWNHQFGPRLFGNLTTYYSRYKFGISVENGYTDNGSTDAYLLKYTSGIEDVALKYDFDYRPNPNHNLRIGLSAVNHTYRPGAFQAKATGSFNQDTTIGVHTLNAMEYDAYVEDDMRITSRLKANIGVHATGFAVRDQFFKSIQPRLALRYLLNDELSLKASFVQMSQFIHLLTNSSVGLPTDLWVPATDKIPPMKSYQGALGLAYTLIKGFEFSLEGYYKTMENVIEYKEGATFLNTTDGWEDKVVSGKGLSYGSEVFIQKKKGRFTGMLGYTLSWTTRQFAELNNGEAFPYRYDRRHDFKVAGVYTLTKNIELSGEWVYGTGNAITMPIGAYNSPDGSQITIYGSRNGYRMAPYHRGDVSIKFTNHHRRWERAWVISVYNVYNRQNPFFIYQTTENGNTVFKQFSLFPVIPSISYQFKF